MPFYFLGLSCDAEGEASDGNLTLPRGWLRWCSHDTMGSSYAHTTFIVNKKIINRKFQCLIQLIKTLLLSIF